MRFVALITCLLSGLLFVGCCASPSVGDLQAIYGPPGIVFEQQSILIDLNDDGMEERLVLLTDERRGLRLPTQPEVLASGIIVDAFALYDGRRPSVPVFYQVQDYDGYALRLDRVDDQWLLVSDGGRDHTQHVWGWWRHEDDWSLDGWETRTRSLTGDRQTYGAWIKQPLVFVNFGK